MATDKQIATAAAATDRARVAWVTLVVGPFGLRWGPYDPARVGELTRAIGGLPGHNAMITLEMGCPSDPVPEILEWIGSTHGDDDDAGGA